MARLRGVIYGCYYGHWQPGLEPGDQDANAANPVHRQIGFTLPKFRARGAGEMPITRIDGAKVGEGRPGPVAQRLRELYVAHAERQAAA